MVLRILYSKCFCHQWLCDSFGAHQIIFGRRKREGEQERKGRGETVPSQIPGAAPADHGLRGNDMGNDKGRKTGEERRREE